MKDIDLKTFPSNRVEALTMLYLQNQDLTELDPKDLVQLYWNISTEIRLAFRNSSRNQNGPPTVNI